MPKKIKEATRDKVAELFPDIVNKVLADYRNIINAGAEKFNKDANHKAYYEACKGAVSHLHLLLKLADWTKVPEEKPALPDGKLQGLLTLLEERNRIECAAYNDEGEMV